MSDFPQNLAAGPDGEALLQQKRFAEAEPLLVGARDRLFAREATIPAIQRAQLPAVVSGGILLYSRWGKTHEAAHWQQKLTGYHAAIKPH